jgi:hypothetical protein
MTDYVGKPVLNVNHIIFIGFVAKILVLRSNSSPKVLWNGGKKVVDSTIVKGKEERERVRGCAI